MISFTVKMEPNSQDFYLQWRHIWYWYIKFKLSFWLTEANQYDG